MRVPVQVRARPGHAASLALAPPWLVGAVPVVCGVLMMQWQAQRELEARALGATQQVSEIAFYLGLLAILAQ